MKEIYNVFGILVCIFIQSERKLLKSFQNVILLENINGNVEFSTTGKFKQIVFIQTLVRYQNM